MGEHEYKNDECARELPTHTPLLIMSQPIQKHFKIGADVSKNENFFLSENGSQKIPNHPRDLKAFLRRLIGKNSSLRVTCESTGSYHDLLVLACLELGVAVSIVNLLDVKSFIRSFGAKAKTDPIDPHYIRRFAIERQPRCLDKSWIQRHEVKELMSFRSRLVE